MSSFLPFVQQVLGAISQAAQPPGSNASHVPVTNETVANLPVAMPTNMNISNWITFLFTFSSMSEWLKLLVLGSLIETLRRNAFYYYYRGISSLYLSAHFDDSDTSYVWILYWLSLQPSWSRARDVQISTSPAYRRNKAVIDLDDDDNIWMKGSRKFTYLPSLTTSYYVWYKYHLVTINRVENGTGSFGQKESTLHISIFAPFSPDLLKTLLQDARKAYLSSEEHQTCVYIAEFGNNWRHVASREKRSLSSIILDPGVKDLLVDDATDFLQSREWYRERGIPFRRGFLLHGTPGSGKTSLIHAVAGELGLDVYILTLSRAGMDDSTLTELMNALPQRCIALMEDIDAAFTQGLSRTSDEEEAEEEATTPKTRTVRGARFQGGINSFPGNGAPPPPPPNRLSLSGLLNALDGLGVGDGRILFATTNKYNSLDPALCRPGRMDLHIEFKNASNFQAQELYRKFYLPKNTEIEDSGEDCIKDSDSDDSGYSSTPGTPTKVEQNTEKTKSPQEVGGIQGNRHGTKGVMIPKEKIAELSIKFADAIPDRECSMASLQGYLMMYKTRPVDAASEVGKWLEKEREDRAAREGRGERKDKLEDSGVDASVKDSEAKAGLMGETEKETQTILS